MTTRTKKLTATPEQFEGMTLMRLRMENVMRIRYVDITVDRTVTVIGGRNEQGKSSLLNGPKWLLGGKEVIEEEPIHDGKQLGKIIGDFGDGKEVKLTLTRTLKRVGDDEWTTDVDIVIPGYIAPTRVVEFLKKLAADKAVDPSEFDEMTDEERFETCRKFAGDFDFRQNSADRKALYDERTTVNGNRDRCYSAANAIVLGERPGEPVDEAALTKELADVGAHNVLIERRRTNRANAATRVNELRDQATNALAQIDIDVAAETARCTDFVGEQEAQITELERDIAVLQTKIADRRTKIAERKQQRDDEHARIREQRQAEAKKATDEADGLDRSLAEAEPLPTQKDAAEIEAQLNAARERNKAIADWDGQKQRRADYLADGDKHAADSDELTAQIAELDRARQEAIAKAHLPVEGIGFGDGVITLRGKPWRQGSTAHRAEASAAISMAMKPHLKVLIFRNAGNFDEDCRRRIQTRAEAEGYRVLMEVVDNTGANSHIYIEDGVVRPLAEQGDAA